MQARRKKVIEHIENEGYRWVSLKKGIIKGRSNNYWRAPALPKGLLFRKSRMRTFFEKWIVNRSNELLTEAHYWRSFYDEFNIYINYIPEEGSAKSIVQAIAFDISKEKKGVLVDKQRSEIYFPLSSHIGHHPKHIFFVWDKRLKRHFRAGCERVERLIVNGYPNDIFSKPDIPEIRKIERLRPEGVNFIAALFDNIHGSDLHLSTKKMAEFYTAFFDWLFEDSTVGLVIKSKKSLVFEKLPSIRPLLQRAIATGRCIKVDDEWGRFPSDVSFSVDMAVGVGISSAVTEVVIGGCKGIHYDMTFLRGHEFYKWGDRSLIFDDLDQMMASLKRYKKDPASELKLGDWSEYLDELEPFRDGKGGMRMGRYMYWLLKGFERNKCRDDVIDYADKLYAEKWGSDTIIKIEDML